MLLPKDIHLFLANKFIDEQHIEFGLEKNEMTHGVIYALLFQNIRVRNNQPAGLKLTREGFIWLKKHYDYYKIETVITITGRHVLYLDRYLEYPYFLKMLPKNHVELYLFGSHDTVELKLLGGDLERWIENRQTGEYMEKQHINEY
jgi:hypothetical protein